MKNLLLLLFISVLIGNDCFDLIEGDLDKDISRNQLDAIVARFSDIQCSNKGLVINGNQYFINGRISSDREKFHPNEMVRILAMFNIVYRIEGLNESGTNVFTLDQNYFKLIETREDRVILSIDKRYWPGNDGIFKPPPPKEDKWFWPTVAATAGVVSVTMFSYFSYQNATDSKDAILYRSMNHSTISVSLVLTGVTAYKLYKRFGQKLFKQ